MGSKILYRKDSRDDLQVLYILLERETDNLDLQRFRHTWGDQ